MKNMDPALPLFYYLIGAVNLHYVRIILRCSIKVRCNQSLGTLNARVAFNYTRSIANSNCLNIKQTLKYSKPKTSHSWKRKTKSQAIKQYSIKNTHITHNLGAGARGIYNCAIVAKNWFLFLFIGIINLIFGRQLFLWLIHLTVYLFLANFIWSVRTVKL